MTQIAQIPKIVAKHIAAGTISGAVVCVSQAGQIELLDAQGVGDLDPNFKLQHDTIFGVFSMTKPVTAACAAQLDAATTAM